MEEKVKKDLIVKLYKKIIIVEALKKIPPESRNHELSDKSIINVMEPEISQIGMELEKEGISGEEVSKLWSFYLQQQDVREEFKNMGLNM